MSRFLLTLLAICLNFAAIAQPTTYRFKNLSTEQGLSSHLVSCIIEDDLGFMWIGTNDGLNRFDGYEFKTFYHNEKDTNSISSNQIQYLHTDKDGDLWIATSNGLNRLNRQTNNFDRIRLIKGDNDFSELVIRVVKEDATGQLWLGTTKGLLVIDKAGNIKNHFKNDPNNRQSLAEDRVGQILFDKKGGVWVGTEKHVNRLNLGDNNFTRFPLDIQVPLDKHPPINDLFQDSKGRIWVTSRISGLNLFDEKQQAFQYYPLKSIPAGDLLLHRTRDIYEAPDGKLWIATYDGIILFDPETDIETKIVHDPNNEYSLSHNGVNRIYEDKRGNLWIGVYIGGVNYLDKNINAIQHYQYTGDKYGPSFNVTSTIAEDKSGKIWLGVERDGLNCFDPITQTFKYYKQDSKLYQNSAAANHIREIAVGKANNLWIGTFYGGLFSFDLATEKFNPIPLIDKNGADLRLAQINSLEVDVKGNLWIASDAGLHYYDTQNKTLLKELTELQGLDLKGTVATIFEDLTGNIWISTSQENGLLYLDNTTGEAKKFALDNVQAIYQDVANELWLGTKRDGLSHLNIKTGAIKKYPLGKINNKGVYGILAGNANNLWLSTDKGIYNFNKADYSLKSFQKEDGIKGNQYKRNAFLEASDGRLYFGGSKGFCVFDPSKIGDENFSPNIVITDFLIASAKEGASQKDNESEFLVKNELIELPWHQNTFFIDFVAINYSRPDKTQYAYKLDGFDDWNYIGNRRNATYTNLNPGSYTFQIKATNGDGVWNSESEILKLHIATPPWQTWWAYLGYLMAISAIIYFVQLNIRNRIRLKNELQLEHLKREQVQQFHELKYRFFTNISHDLKTPLTLIMGPLEQLLNYYTSDVQVRRQLTVAYKNGERLLNLIGQLMDFRKLETNHNQLRVAQGNFTRFANEIFLSFQEAARFRGIDYTFEAEAEPIMVYFDRDKLEKVLFNLLSNAFKYTPDGGLIQVILASHAPTEKFKEGHLRLSIQDSGKGMTEQVKKHLFNPYVLGDSPTFNQESSSGIGLSIAKGLTDLHKGTIEVTSEFGEGSTFMLCLPLGKTHLSEEAILGDFNDSDAPVHYLKSGAELAEAVKEKVTNIAVQPPANIAEQPLLLIVEDNPDIQQYIVDIFQQDYRLLLATNGKQGFDKALKNNPDLIISDVMMPEVNGIDFCSQVKRELKTSHIPVILLSARTSLIFKVNGLETGADDYINKPFSQKVLQLKVKNLLATRKSLQQRFRKEANLNLKNIAVSTADERFLEKLIQLIETNMKEPKFGVEYLGGELRITRVHLYRKIKALTNMTATEFVRTIRLRFAKKLLTTTFLNINEVSYEIGFQDPSYFRKCFKQQFGVSPTKYRDNPMAYNEE